jgi:hypothetical protein
MTEAATNEPTLADRAATINRLYGNFDKASATLESDRIKVRSARIEVGRALIDAREHVPAGEWNAWCKANIKRSRMDISRVMKIAGAEDPNAAHEAVNAARRADAAERNTAVLHAEPVVIEPPAVLATSGLWNETPPTVIEPAAGITPRARLPRIKNTITVPDQVEGETADQKTERLFLFLASGDLEVCNKIVRELGLQSVESEDSLNRMIDAAQDVIVAWERVKLELIKRHSAYAAPVEVEVVAALPELVIEEPDIAMSGEVEVEPVAKCPVADCEGGNRWETVDGVRHDLGQCGVCHPEAYAAEVSAPVVIKAKGNKRSRHGAVISLTVEQYEAAKRAEAETPKERADRRRAAKEAQKEAA